MSRNLRWYRQAIDDWVTDILTDLSEIDRWSYCFDEENNEVYVFDSWTGARYAGAKMDIDH
jgi:hypothetical protein